MFRDFPTFSRTWIFFLLRLSLLRFSLFFSSSPLLSSRLLSSPFLSSPLLSSPLFFSSLLFSDSPHLCFSSVHIVGSLTSKLPSNILALALVEDEFTWFYLVWLKVNQSWAGDAIMDGPHVSAPGLVLSSSTRRSVRSMGLTGNGKLRDHSIFRVMWWLKMRTLHLSLAHAIQLKNVERVFELMGFFHLTVFDIWQDLIFTLDSA